MTELASLMVRIGADTANLTRGLNTANTGIRNFGTSAGRSLQSIGSNMTGLGTSLGLLITPLAGIGYAAISASIEFESAFTNVSKTVEGTDEELAILKDTLREMATGDSPVAGLENALLTLTDIAAVAGSLGVPTDQIAGFAEKVAILDAASDDLDADEAATFIGHFQNVTGMSFDDLDSLVDTVVTLGNKMATTEGQIGAFATRLAPLATFKWEPKDILAYSAALGSLGVSPELGSTNLFKSVVDLTTAVSVGGEPLQNWADAAGLAADEFAALAAADPEGAFTKFIEGLSKLDADTQLQTLTELGITSSEQVSTIMRLAGGYDTLAEALSISGDAWRGNGAAMEEALAKVSTTEGDIEKLKNKVYDLKISIGDALTTALGDAAVKLMPLVDGLSQWAQENPETVQTIAAITLGVGGLAVALTVAGLAFGAMGTALAVVLSPIGVLIGAVAGLGLLIHATLPGIVESWGKAFEEIGEFIQTVINKVGELIAALGSVLPVKGPRDTSNFDAYLQENMPGGGGGSTWVDDVVGQLPNHANGLSFVPHDNYVARLHKGEAVLTANQNRAQSSGSRSGGGTNVNIYGGIFPNGAQEFAEYVKTILQESGY